MYIGNVTRVLMRENPKFPKVPTTHRCGVIQALNCMPICSAFGVILLPKVKRHCYLNELTNTKPETPLGMCDQLAEVHKACEPQL